MGGSEQSSLDAAPMLSGASGDVVADTAPHSWVTPRVVLWAFSAVNLLLYFDRGATAGALSSIRIDPALTSSGLALSDARSGFLVSGFTIGYIFASPFFASRGSAWGSRAVILLGVALWCITCVGCALAFSYASLLLCRILVGVSEAAFVGFTVTIVDNIAPPAQRTSWIGVFYAMIPVGTAVGMGCGGALTSYPVILGLPPWRLVYLLEVVAALPVVVLVYSIPAAYHLAPAADAVGASPSTQLPFLAATGRVLGNAKYVLLVLGFSTYCFATGAVSTWGIPLLHEGPLQMSKAAAAGVMGLATTFSGVVGSLLGGLAVDHWGGSTGVAGAMQCQQFNILMILVAIPVGMVALLSTDATAFVVAFVVAVAALFAITAPFNASMLSAVPAELRPYAASYCVFIIHLLGDFPSPTLAGLVSDYLGRHCRGRQREECAAASPELRCTWVDDANGRGRCVCRVQLRDALMLVFAYLSVAPPCWAAVWWLLRQEKRAGDGVVFEAAAAAVLSGTEPPPTPICAHDERSDSHDAAPSLKGVHHRR
ncbi:major facilitator superfamily protein (MFS) [Novymonas esmeraldas]|uniref:Major facilitator superfamily protein (MFS) n=1 Tax=Novymonas esmeraldas TaxID=1808958 RepID=A0AAW0EY57_9TRYP